METAAAMASETIIATTSNSTTSIQIPLIDSSTPTSTTTDHQQPDAHLEKSLDALESFLTVFGFCHYSPLATALSWLVFSLLSVVAPLLVIIHSSSSPSCSDYDIKYEIKTFEVEILFSQAVVASISLLFISHNLRKYGVKKLLFIDRCYFGHLAEFRHLYIRNIHEFYRVLAVWIGLCLVLKTAREVTRVIYLQHGPWWLSAAIVLASLVPWAYSTTVFLSGTALFNLVGKLQVIHFENYGKLLERDLDVSVYIKEHMRLAYCLSKISHRFRGFLLLEFLVITGSQFAALFATTGNKGIINFINAGDFAVLLIVQLVGILMCLNTAARISHRAQGLGSVACTWHALVTCDINDGSQSGISTNGGISEAANPVSSLTMNVSESDLESSEFTPLTTHAQFSSASSSYIKRQTFVAYVQSNTGGFTIFGFIIDRMFINSLFFIELSLVFFVLGKTISVTTR